MEHIAILRKAKIKKGDDLLGDILAGKKTIESRWCVNKVAPWNKVKVGETIYFKETGCPITAKAEVSKVLQFEKLNKEKITEIIKKYGKQIAPNITETEFIDWSKSQKNKNYCILVFLEKVEKLVPFNINKKGYGVAAAWITTENIKNLLF